MLPIQLYSFIVYQVYAINRTPPWVIYRLVNSWKTKLPFLHPQWILGVLFLELASPLLPDLFLERVPYKRPPLLPNWTSLSKSTQEVPLLEDDHYHPPFSLPHLGPIQHYGLLLVNLVYSFSGVQLVGLFTASERIFSVFYCAIFALYIAFHIFADIVRLYITKNISLKSSLFCCPLSLKCKWVPGHYTVHIV